MPSHSNINLRAAAVVTLCAASAAAGYTPACFAANHVLNTQLPDKFGEQKTVERVSTDVNDDKSIRSVIKTCYSADTGEQQPEEVCVKEITEAIVACAFSSIAYQDGMQQSKREDPTTKVIDALGSDIQVHAVYNNDKDVTSQFASHPKMAVSSAKGGAKNYKLKEFDNSMPITALVSSKRSNDDKTLPFYISSNGETSAVGHTVAVKKEDSDDPSQVSGWELRQDGAGVKIQSNSDPVANYNDVVDWLSQGDDQFGTVLNVFVEGTRSEWLGGALHDSKSNGYLDGQWLAEVKHDKFDLNWETGWNWCYGVYKTNCDSEQVCPKSK